MATGRTGFGPRGKLYVLSSYAEQPGRDVQTESQHVSEKQTRPSCEQCHRYVYTNTRMRIDRISNISNLPLKLNCQMLVISVSAFMLSDEF